MARYFNPFAQYFTDAGRVVPGAKLYFYENNTTTPKTTWADANYSVANPNPVVCDSAGRIPPIFMEDDEIYSITFTDANDVQIDQGDDITGVNSDVLGILAAAGINISASEITISLDVDLNGDLDISGTPKISTNNRALTGVASSGFPPADIPLIKANASDQVEIDPDGNGTLVSGTLDASDEINVVKAASGSEVELLELRNNGTANGTAGRIKFVNSTASGSNSGSVELVAERVSGNTAGFTIRVGNVASSMNDVLGLTPDGADITGTLGVSGDATFSGVVDITRNAAGEYASFGGSTDGGQSRPLKLSSEDIGAFLGARHFINSSSGSGELVLQTGGTDALSIDSSQNVTAEDCIFRVNNSAINEQNLFLRQEGATFTNDVILARTTVAAGTGFNFMECQSSSGASVRMRIAGDGDLENANNSYGGISDRKHKQDEELAKSQTEDVKNIARIAKKYRMRSDVNQFGEDAHYHIGLIAQDLEAISPGLVRETEDKEEVILEPAQEEITELQPLAWQKPVMVEIEEVVPAVTEQQAVINEETGYPEIVTVEVKPATTQMVEIQATEKVTETVTVPEAVVNGVLIPEHEESREVEKPLFTTETVVDENGEVVMRPVVVQAAKEAVTEIRPNGETTKSVKYSILYMKCVKALGELIERVEALENA